MSMNRCNNWNVKCPAFDLIWQISLISVNRWTTKTTNPVSRSRKVMETKRSIYLLHHPSSTRTDSPSIVKVSRTTRGERDEEKTNTPWIGRDASDGRNCQCWSKNKEVGESKSRRTSPSRTRCTTSECMCTKWRNEQSARECLWSDRRQSSVSQDEKQLCRDVRESHAVDEWETDDRSCPLEQISQLRRGRKTSRHKHCSLAIEWRRFGTILSLYQQFSDWISFYSTLWTPVQTRTSMVPIGSSASSSTLPLQVSSEHLKNAFDRHMYIASESDLSCSILCYDHVLCYLSNIIDQGTSSEIERNLLRYFSTDQLRQAYEHLHDCLDYVLASLVTAKDHELFKIVQQCSTQLIDGTCLVSVMQTIHRHGLFSSLPIFVAHNWMEMIRHVQNLEKFDRVSASIPTLKEQMSHLKDHLTALHQLVYNFHDPPSGMHCSLAPSNEQCCLRTYCTHNTVMYRSAAMMDSPSSSSWSSLEFDVNPITAMPGFVRNPVTNFLIPTAPEISEMEMSVLSIDEVTSSDEEQESPWPSLALNRSLSCQPTMVHQKSVLVKRHDDLWIYPAGVIKPKANPLFSSTHEATDDHEFSPRVTRASSFDDRFHLSNPPRPLPEKSAKKPRKASNKPSKGS